MYRFRGFPPFLEAQAERLGLHAHRAAEARRVSELHNMSTLIAQATDPHKHPRERNAIFAQAALCRDRLAIAYAAAEAMLEEAAEGLDVELEDRRFWLRLYSPSKSAENAIPLGPPDPQANASLSEGLTA